MKGSVKDPEDELMLENLIAKRLKVKNALRDLTSQKSLHFTQLLKLALISDSIFIKEVRLFNRSDKSAAYCQRLYYAGILYDFASQKIKIASTASFIAGQNEPFAANDSEFNSDLSKIKNLLAAAKLCLNVVIASFNLDLEIEQGNGSPAYLSALKALSGMSRLNIEKGWLLINHNWDKSTPQVKKVFDTLIDIEFSKYEDIQHNLRLHSKIRDLEPSAEKFKKWVDGLQVNQRKAIRAASKYTPEIRAEWIVKAGSIKSSNSSLSLSAIAKRIAGAETNSYETIRKHLSKHLNK